MGRITRVEIDNILPAAEADELEQPVKADVFGKFMIQNTSGVYRLSIPETDRCEIGSSLSNPRRNRCSFVAEKVDSIVSYQKGRGQVELSRWVFFEPSGFISLKR